MRNGPRANPSAPAAIALAVAVAVCVYALAFAIVPSARERLIVEDGIIETTTALVFVAAAVIGVAALWRSRRRARWWLIPALGLLGFLDEMSFGARIFGFPLPVIDGMEVDSFHDAFDLADRFAGDLGLSRTMIAAFLAAAALAAGAYLLRTGRMRRIPAWLAAHRPLAIAAAAVGLLLAGIALDLLASGDLAVFAEETAEFGAAGLVAMAAADLFTTSVARVPVSVAGGER